MRSMFTGRSSTQRRTALTICLGLAVVIAVSVWTACFPATMQRLDLMAFDLFLYRRGVIPPTGDVVIASIDDRSVAKLGRWAWPRAIEARLLDALRGYGVAVVGFDLVFSEPEPADVERHRIAPLLERVGIGQADIEKILGPENDVAFARSMASQGWTYIGYFFDSPLSRETQIPPSATRRTVLLDPPPISYDIVTKTTAAERLAFSATAYLPPLSEINKAARGTGYVNIKEDVEGGARSFPTVIRFKDRYCAPLFLALADAYLKNPPLGLELNEFGVSSISIGDRPIPVDDRGEMMVRFRGPAGTMPHYSVVDIIEHRIPAAALKSKIVIVGVTATGLGDRFSTPAGSDFPGVEIQASAADNVLKGDFVHHSYGAEVEEQLAGWILGITITLAAAYAAPAYSFAALIVLAASYVIYSIGRLDADGALVGIAFPAVTLSLTYLVIVSYRYVTEGVEKRRLRRAFVHYLAPSLVDKLAESPSELRLGGENREITVMFADLSGFTAASTRMTPEDLTSRVNRYFEYIVKPIDDTGGYVERFVGDAVMGMWGAPLSDGKHAIKALRAALSIIDGVRRLREQDQARGEDGFTIKIGVNSGQAVVGNIGSENRCSYTAMGEDINLASRLEGVPPLYGCLIVAGEHTGKLAQSGFLLRELDWLLVKGAAKPMAVYEPIAELDRASDDQRNLVTRFAQALQHYRAKRFVEAAAIWDELVSRYEPSPSPSSVMAARARELIANPPDAKWDGVHMLTSK
jgi:adenylate cyclase